MLLLFQWLRLSDELSNAMQQRNLMWLFLLIHNTCTIWYSIKCFMALWILSRTTWVSRYQKKHSATCTYCGHQSSLICFLHLLWSIASSLFNLRAWQSFSTISLQVFFGLPLGLASSTSYISSSNHCHLFAAHAHTIATSFAVVPRLCHLILVFLSTLYLEHYAASASPSTLNMSPK